MLNCARMLLLTLALCLAFAGSAGALCPVADLNDDCRVDSGDLQFLAERWLDPPESPADLDGDDRVAMLDFALLAEDWQRTGTGLAINELCASNLNYVIDPQGEYEDWIEIHNLGDEPVDMGGMYLTDDLDDPTKWRIPDDSPATTTVQPHGYLLIWADNDVGDPGLHANFRIDAGGDELGLFARDGVTVIDTVTFGQQTSNVSYGRYPDAMSSWRLMFFPTPGGANISIYQGVVAEPRLSHERGFYETPFSVTITTATEGGNIYYTLDGTDPYSSERGRPGGKLYTGPIPIDRTTCLKVQAVKYGWMPSRAKTHTYIFVSDVKNQSPNGQVPGPGWPSSGINGQRMEYGMDRAIVNHTTWGRQIEAALTSIPTMSIVTDLGNLFDSEKGIYVNARGHGRTWERPASLELIYPPDPEGPGFPDLVKVTDSHGAVHWELPRDMRDGFQINAGLRIRGGYSRSGNNPKHAFRFFFRPEYGDGALDYPLFGDEGADGFDKVDLRTSQNYSWSFGNDSANTMCREVWARDSQGLMGQPYTRSRYYHLYINGHYWGLFQTQERSEASYAASYFGGNQEEYDTVKSTGDSGGYTIEATDGNMDAWQELWDLANLGFGKPDNYYRAQGLNPDGTRNPNYKVLLDVDNLIDYMIMVFYDGDRDAPISWFLGNNRTNNWYGIRNRYGNEGFRYFVHDPEHIMSRGLRDRTGPFSCGDQFRYSNPQWMHQELMANAEYRMRFADRAHKYLFNNGLLTASRAIARFRARSQQIDMAIIAESARWGSAWLNKDTWLSAINNEINGFFPSRTGVLLGQLRTTRMRNGSIAPLYPSVTAPTFSQHGGYVPSGFRLYMSAPIGTIYYTLDGSDPMHGSSGGGSTTTTTLVAESAAKKVLVPPVPVSDNWKGGGAFNDSSWMVSAGSPGGVGYERGSGYEGLISLDLESKMYGENSSCYVRIPFNVISDPSQFEFLTLRMRYDDGFVAYINGVEVQRALAPDELTWDSEADGSHEADGLEDFSVTDHIGDLRQGDNLLAIHGLNTSTTSSDFVISAELVAGTSDDSPGDGSSPTAFKYTGPVTLTETTQVKARVLSGSTWSALNEAIFAIGPVADYLRITEIMYNPEDANHPDDPNREFIELKNVGPETINLNLVHFTNGVEFVFPRLDLVADEYVLVVKDVNAFEAKYGAGLNIAGQYTGSLRNGGERVELQDAIGTTIQLFRYRDGWYDITDGDGFSLTVKDPAGTHPSQWGDKATWRPSAHVGGSPGADDTGQIPELGDVVINEILAHSHAAAPDWIELHNTTDHTINIGGWFLSDDDADLRKYEIADGKSIPAHGYIVFTEDVDFGGGAARVPFGLSENGETLYLHSGRDGELTGYSEQEKFGASVTGVAFGRYQKSTGAYNFVAMSVNTPGSANAYPKVGPIVISEIMYHPDSPTDAEYVELLNISDADVTLYDFVTAEPWRFTDDPDNPGIEFLFPAEPPVTVASGEYILMVKDLATFSSKFTAPVDTQIFSWGAGRLDNGGEKIQISLPGDVDVDGVRHYIRVDRVRYSDGSHPDDFASGVDPWPTGADGFGSTLSRLFPQHYGNDPNNWQAITPSPGKANP
ncbi:MAG: lamin tail domain-containing protein [Phycisphaerales bacterium]|nr:MAG: lamin tail domain-containing protein [Phycisphaerales bacterium]